jgi:hypothetical protein
MPIPPAPVIGGGGRNDKLVGNTPLIFKGERSRAEEFITQWQLYEGVNITNDLMRNAYQRAMLFLTYIQGLSLTNGSRESTPGSEDKLSTNDGHPPTKDFGQKSLIHSTDNLQT